MRYWLLLFYLLLAGWQLHAQESVLGAGGSVSGTEGFVSYSVGQVAFVTGTGASGISSEGVQQPYEILFMPGISDDPAISLTCMAYPNPTAGKLVLTIEFPIPGDLKYDLTNLNGVVLQTEKINLRETMLDLSQLAPASYYLTVFKQRSVIKTYKIIRK